MLNKVFKKISSITMLVVIAFAVFMPGFLAQAQVPFGGAITSVFFCIGAEWITIGPPTPMSLMYAPGSLSYAYGPPSHIGQWLLGLATAPLVCFEPCPVGACPVGGGLFILFHGSSA